jgi:hypothetical protein
MKRYQKQLLIYMLLIFMSGLSMYYGISGLSLDNQIKHSSKEQTSFSKPQASAMAILLKPLMSNRVNAQSIILFTVIILGPVWIFSGYIFARKMTMPGIYKENPKKLKIFAFIILLCLFVEIFFPQILKNLCRINLSPYQNRLMSLSYLVLSFSIIFELIFKLFGISLIVWLLNLLNQGRVKRDLINWFSIVLVSLVQIIVFTLYLNNQNLFHLQLFSSNGIQFVETIRILIILILNIILGKIYISRGVLFSIICQFVALIMLNSINFIFLK